MRHIYSPNRKVFIFSAIAILVSVGVMYSAVLMANNSIQARLVGLLLFVPFTLYIILLFFANVTLSDYQIRIVVLLIFRHSANISEIRSIKYRSKMLGGTDVIEIHYGSKPGVDKKMSFTINAYGKTQAKEIIDLLIKHNPSIKVDNQIYRYL